MFLFVVLPSVFPLCVLSDWLIRTGAFRIAGRFIGTFMIPLFGVSKMGALSVITSLIGSYPTAAKTTAQLYKNGEISYEDAVKLTAFTNNAGPLFIIGVIGTNMLQSSKLGVLLWFFHIMASVLTGAILGKYFKTNSTFSNNTISVENKQEKKTNSFLQLSASIASAMETMIPVCGTVLFFASLCALMEAKSIPVLQPFSNIIEMLLEMTTGCQTAARISFNSLSVKGALIARCCLFSGIVAWGGCSVHMQTIYIFSQTGISCSRYVIGKILHTAISVFLTALGLLIVL